jgi:putative tricarboxylic transport membrane protein
MSENISPAGTQRKLTTGHQTRDLWAGLLPIPIALLDFEGARYFDPLSPLGMFLWAVGLALVGLGLFILIFRVHVPNHRDYYGGLALLALAVFCFWAGADLPGLRGFSFGAGTAPRLFGIGLILVSAAIMAEGLMTYAEPLGSYAIRGPFFVTLAILSFSFLIRGATFEWGESLIRIPPFGLIIASFVTFMISALASKETRWIEATIVAAVLTAFCWALFVWLLGLPFELWPRF